MSPKPLVLLVLSVLWVSASPLPAATIPLQNAALSGSTTLSGTLTSASAATVDLRLGNILLPSTPATALTNGTISGNSIISSGTLSIGAATFISGTASTVDLRLGNILLPTSASGTSNFSGSNAVLSGTSSLASGTFTIASGATFLSAASSSIDLRLGTVQLPSSVSLLGQSIDLATEVSGTLPTSRVPVMTGDTGTGGTAGLVPAPATGDATKVLYGNGTWATPPGAAGGEANTASNLGTSSDGEGLFSAKSGVDLQFKRIKAGTNITLSTSGSSVIINSTATSGTGSSSGSSSDTPDNFPSSPSSYDDEFTTSYSGSWQWRAVSSSTYNTLTINGGKLLYNYGYATTQTNYRAFERPAPAGNTFTVTTKVWMPLNRGTYGIYGGILVRNSSTGQSRACALQQYSTSIYLSSLNIAADEITTGNQTDVNLGLISLYLRIKCDGTNIITSYSQDGSFYIDHSTQTIASVVGNIDRIGVFVRMLNGVSYVPTVVFDYVRVTTP